MEKVTKVCKTCKEEKTIDWFYFRTDSNSGLGMFKDNIELMKNAINYLNLNQ